MDGAVVSALPIEPAIRCGATEIVALDLTDPRDTFGQANGVGVFINRLTYAVEQRQVDLELQVARAQQVPVLHVRLNSSEPVPIWDFRCAQQLISEGYQVARQILQETSAARMSPASQT